ncbi:MAG: chemotaxis protein CheW [Halanaerobiales bacterium]|nr:chemotaxis protein CheW [Halanaerobiales bacterium]
MTKTKDVKNKKNTAETKQFLTFKVGKEIYGLRLNQAKEIIKPPKITSVPNSEEYILGVINLRGQVVPVINLKNKLGLKEQSNLDINQEKAKKIVVINIKGMLIGVYVDGVNEVINISVEDIEDVTENKTGIREEFIKGVSTYGDYLIIVLDLDNLLFENKEEKGA